VDGGGQPPVSMIPVISIVGPSFDGARFGEARFAAVEDGTPRFNEAVFDEDRFDNAATGVLEVTTPSVHAGANAWEYAPLDDEGRAAATQMVLALGGQDPGLEPVGEAEIGEPIAAEPVAFRLRWWTRPSSRFLLRIPLTESVRRLVNQGAADYVRQLVDRVRPVGVTPIIDFLEPPIREALDPGDALADTALEFDAPVDPVVTQASDQDLPAEMLEPLDSAAFGGVFDVTPFDFSLFDIELVELPADAVEPETILGVSGLFDVVPFGLGRFTE
nr:hypothetical protein [Deltaproteobacteria bacterium]